MRKLLSSEHFSADGTLIESYASMKSFRSKDEDDNNDGGGNGWADFRGKMRSNDTHESKTDSDARLIRKGKGREAKLAFIANALSENHNGLVVGFGVEPEDGRAERDGALDVLERAVGGDRRLTLWSGGGGSGGSAWLFAGAAPFVARGLLAPDAVTWQFTKSSKLLKSDRWHGSWEGTGRMSATARASGLMLVAGRRAGCPLLVALMSQRVGLISSGCCGSVARRARLDRRVGNHAC